MKISVVLPCRNERQAIGHCIGEIKDSFGRSKLITDYEIIVSDSSTDGSDDIAENLGVRVIRHNMRGYGNALRIGIESAKYDNIIFADADMNYDFNEVEKIALSLSDSDLVIRRRKWRQNRLYSKNVSCFVCNSKNTSSRLKKFLEKDSEVINPPVDTASFFFRKSEGYWLSLSRLINHKRIKLQLEAFRKMTDKKLVIVGSYEKAGHFRKYRKKILKIMPENVIILSHVPQDKLIELYARSIGMITTSKDEDFGMNVIESYAAGKPVIAVNESSYKETVINGNTGKLIEPYSESIIEAVNEIEKNIKQGYDYKGINQN